MSYIRLVLTPSDCRSSFSKAECSLLWSRSTGGHGFVPDRDESARLRRTVSATRDRSDTYFPLEVAFADYYRARNLFSWPLVAALVTILRLQRPWPVQGLVSAGSTGWFVKALASYLSRSLGEHIKTPSQATRCCHHSFIPRSQPHAYMSSKKIVTVFGATGVVGGSVAKYLLEDGQFAVRAITRSASSDKAKGRHLRSRASD